MIDSKSKTFFLIILIAFIIVVLGTYYDTVILKNFVIFTSEDQIPTYSDLLTKIKELTSYVR